MSISDLFFVILALGTVITASAIAIALVRGRFKNAGRWALWCGAVWLVYLVAGFVIAMATPFGSWRLVT